MNDLKDKTKSELIEEIEHLQELENQYHENQELLESIVEDPVDIIIVSIDWNYRILYFNKRFIEYVQEELKTEVNPQLDDCIWDYVTNVEQLKTYFDRALAGEKSFQEIIREREDRRVYYEFRYSPIYNEDDEIIGMSAFFINITDRREAEIAVAQKQEELVEGAYKAGMADIASEVMHNIGNTLNSVLTTGNVLLDLEDNSQIKNILKANELLQSNMDNLEDFLLHDPKGPKLLQYYLGIGQQLEDENLFFKEKITRLLEKANIIRDIIQAQQEYATGEDIWEEIALDDIINDAIKIQGDLFIRHNITLTESLHALPKIKGSKTKMLYVFISIIKNAQEALSGVPNQERQFKIETQKSNDEIICKFTDNGEGISGDHLKLIFNHGYTTREGKSGNGLHCCANYLAQMKGKIQALSEGKNQGTTIIITFPLKES